MASLHIYILRFVLKFGEKRFLEFGQNSTVEVEIFVFNAVFWGTDPKFRSSIFEYNK